MPSHRAAAPAAGRRRFGPLDVTYDDRVLVPRPWTLVQSRWAAEEAASAGPGPLLELCAGVGHIGLAAAVLAGRDLVQVEVDPVAATFAMANAELAGWDERVEVRLRPLESALAPDERFPLVIADPPYLPSADIGRFPEDPPLAVDGGPDGLSVVRGCLAVAASCLVARGALLIQVAGPRQAEAVATLAEEAGPLRAEGTRVVDEERAVLLLRHSG